MCTRLKTETVLDCAQVGTLHMLEHLFLACNRLTSIPPLLEKLSSLVSLDLSFNEIPYISSDPRTLRILVCPETTNLPDILPPQL